MPLDTHGQRLQPAEHHEAVEGREDRAGRVLEEAELLGEGVVRGHGHAADHVAVPVQVLGHRVDDDVGAHLEGPLEHGGREGVVHNDGDPSISPHGGHRLDIENLQQRIGRRFHPNHLRIRPKLRLNPLQVLHIANIALIELSSRICQKLLILKDCDNPKTLQLLSNQ